MSTDERKVLRSVFFDVKMDEVLRQAAFRRRISKSELIRMYVEKGIMADETEVAATNNHTPSGGGRKPISVTPRTYRPKSKGEALVSTRPKAATASDKRQKALA